MSNIFTDAREVMQTIMGQAWPQCSVIFNIEEAERMNWSAMVKKFEESTLATTVGTGAASATQTLASTLGIVAGNTLYFATAGVFRTVLSVTNSTTLVLTATVTTTTGEAVSRILGIMPPWAVLQPHAFSQVTYGVSNQCYNWPLTCWYITSLRNSLTGAAKTPAQYIAEVEQAIYDLTAAVRVYNTQTFSNFESRVDLSSENSANRYFGSVSGSPFWAGSVTFDLIVGRTY